MKWLKYTDLAVVWVIKDTKYNKKVTTVNVRNPVTQVDGTILVQV